jgi:carbamoyl-phosphate synthase large subunit
MSSRWLFSTIGKRAYIADYFRDADPAIWIAGSGNTDFTPGFRGCDESVILPDINAPNYLEAVRELIRDYRIDAVLSFSDPDVARLSSIREELTAAGVKCFFPGPALARMGFDKLETAQWALRHGILTPHTVSTPQQALQELAFPLIRKPRFGSGSAGVTVVRRSEDLFPAVGDKTQYIYQELIAGEELNVEICGDLCGRTIGVSAWRKLLSRNGETELAVTTRRPDLIEHGLCLGRKAAIVGPCDVDLIDRGGQLFLIEFNMRFGGGYPVSHLAGAEFPDLLLRAQRGENPAIHTGFEDEIFMMKTLQPFGGRLSDAKNLFGIERQYRNDREQTEAAVSA